MAHTKTRWTTLCLGLALSIGIPLNSIRSHYRVLEDGEIVKFPLAPIDPYDPFRGRYIWLRFELNTANWEAGDEPEFDRLESAYLSVERDEDGFVRKGTLHQSRPEQGNSIKVGRVYRNYKDSWYFELPFDRYYLNEKDAPLAEELAREALRGQDQEDHSEPSYLVLRSWGDKLAIEALYLGDKPIEERLAEVR